MTRIAPLELISALAWERVTFTTYALSLSFFEAIVLSGLVRAGGKDIVILADIEGVRMALGERGARRVGKDYDVEPVNVKRGVFHPKISVLKSTTGCHVLVGSGNLTFGGWGGNLESLEHLHSDFAPDAIEDIAVFFELLALSDNAHHCAGYRCRAIAQDLRLSIRNQPRNTNVRVLHSLDGAISDKLHGLIVDLGGATRLTAVSPFWDGGLAIDDICQASELSECFVHVHPGGTVEGIAGMNWPTQASTTVKPVHVEALKEVKPRRLHAKLFEIICRRGRLIVSGSANATRAALTFQRNIEACVVRIERDPISNWSLSGCAAPVPLMPLEGSNNDDDDAISGVLRATLEDDKIIGQVLTPPMEGRVSIRHLTNIGAKQLGDVLLEKDAKFSLRVPDFELESWRYGRLVLQVIDSDNRHAEGFVSVAVFAEIARRAGAVAPRLFSLLAGTETPADVAAIMSWFQEDPDRLFSEMTPRFTSGASEERYRQEEMVDVDSLVPIDVTSQGYAGEVSRLPSWRRFMDHIFSALRERRGPFDYEDDEESEDGDTKPKGGKAKGKTQGHKKSDPGIARSLDIFKKLFRFLISTAGSQRHGIIAFDLTHYVCERLRPDQEQVVMWLRSLLEFFCRVGPPPDRRDDVAASVLVWLASDPQSDRARIARRWLIRLGYELTVGVPSPERISGFQSTVTQMTDLASAWSAIRSVRTFEEQARAYFTALQTGQASSEYSDLQHSAPDEWPILEKALAAGRTHDNVLVLRQWSATCPLHFRDLPSIERTKLRTVRVATTRNCCHRVMLYLGDD